MTRSQQEGLGDGDEDECCGCCCVVEGMDRNSDSFTLTHLLPAACSETGNVLSSLTPALLSLLLRSCPGRLVNSQPIRFIISDAGSSAPHYIKKHDMKQKRDGCGHQCPGRSERAFILVCTILPQLPDLDEGRGTGIGLSIFRRVDREIGRIDSDGFGGQDQVNLRANRHVVDRRREDYDAHKQLPVVLVLQHLIVVVPVSGRDDGLVVSGRVVVFRI